MKKNRISFKTIGCKANFADTSDLTAALTDLGFMIVSSSEHADVVIVNSCVVTHKAEGDSRRALARGKRENRGAVSILTGCGASPLVPGSLKERADAVVRMDGIAIAEKIDELRGIKTSPKRVTGGEIKNPRERARKFIKIQNGCDNRCAYCIVPLARGKSISHNPDTIAEKVKRAEHEGFPEIVFTGTHIGHYGYDNSDYPSLSGLLRDILDETDKIRIRLSSIEIDEIDTPLSEMICNDNRVCSHLHIPLQSGDDAILERMGRWYSTGQFSETLQELRRKSSYLCIGTDIITGFPGESDLQFNNTYRFLEDAKIDYFHVFTYSKRAGSHAALLGDQVKEEVKKIRSGLLRELGRRKKEAFLDRMIGIRVKIACEKVREVEGKFEGTSGNYMKVVSKGSGVTEGDIVPVVITGHNGKLAEGILGC